MSVQNHLILISVNLLIMKVPLRNFGIIWKIYYKISINTSIRGTGYRIGDVVGIKTGDLDGDKGSGLKGFFMYWRNPILCFLMFFLFL